MVILFWFLILAICLVQHVALHSLWTKCFTVLKPPLIRYLLRDLLVITIAYSNLMIIAFLSRTRSQGWSFIKAKLMVTCIQWTSLQLTPANPFPKLSSPAVNLPECGTIGLVIPPSTSYLRFFINSKYLAPILLNQFAPPIRKERVVVSPSPLLSPPPQLRFNSFTMIYGDLHPLIVHLFLKFSI